MSRLGLGLVVAAALAHGASMVRADLLVFRRGGQVDLPIQIEGTTVTVVTPGGVRLFPREAFRLIEPTPSRAAQWAAQQAQARGAATAASWFAAGWWALQRGWTTEAISAFEQARALPGAEHHAALVRVGQTLDHLRRPPGAVDLTATLGLLGGSQWSVRSGRHLTLVHQASQADAQSRLDLLDDVAEVFFLTMAGQGVDCRVPDGRLISVWFADRRDYLACLRRADAAPFANTQGYYHPNHRVVLAYDTRSHADQAEARRTLAAGPRDSDAQADRERRRLLLDLDWLSIDSGIAAHETVHQLVAASGLAPRFDDWPHWLHEGWAAQFEGVRNGQWAGIGSINPHRWADWRPGPLTPLLNDDGLTQGYQRERYAQAALLVAFLRQTHPTEFVTFLDLLHSPRPDGRPLAAETAFRAAFGSDLAALQRDWHRFSQDRLARTDPTSLRR